MYDSNPYDENGQQAGASAQQVVQPTLDWHLYVYLRPSQMRIRCFDGLSPSTLARYRVCI
jgi:hypothetical protein